jgi:hypothetical protein
MMKSTYAKMLITLAMAGVFMDAGGLGGYESESKGIDKMTDEEMNRLMAEMKRQRTRLLLKKGCKEYHYGDVTIIALNDKNAERKYNNYLKNKI